MPCPEGEPVRHRLAGTAGRIQCPATVVQGTRAHPQAPGHGQGSGPGKVLLQISTQGGRQAALHGTEPHQHHRPARKRLLHRKAGVAEGPDIQRSCLPRRAGRGIPARRPGPESGAPPARPAPPRPRPPAVPPARGAGRCSRCWSGPRAAAAPLPAADSPRRTTPQAGQSI